MNTWSTLALSSACWGAVRLHKRKAPLKTSRGHHGFRSGLPAWKFDPWKVPSWSMCWQQTPAILMHCLSDSSTLIISVICGLIVGRQTFCVCVAQDWLLRIYTTSRCCLMSIKLQGWMDKARSIMFIFKFFLSPSHQKNSLVTLQSWHLPR